MKVKIREALYSSKYGGKLPKDAVVEVPDDVGERWVTRGIGEKSTAKTFREDRLAKLRAEAAKIEKELAADQEASAAWDLERRDVPLAEARVETAEQQLEAAKEQEQAARAAQRRRGAPGPLNAGPLERPKA